MKSRTMFVIVAVVAVHRTMAHCDNPRLFGSVLRLVGFLFSRQQTLIAPVNVSAISFHFTLHRLQPLPLNVFCTMHYIPPHGIIANRLQILLDTGLSIKLSTLMESSQMTASNDHGVSLIRTWAAHTYEHASTVPSVLWTQEVAQNDGEVQWS